MSTEKVASDPFGANWVGEYASEFIVFGGVGWFATCVGARGIWGCLSTSIAQMKLTPIRRYLEGLRETLRFEDNKLKTTALRVRRCRAVALLSVMR